MGRSKEINYSVILMALLVKFVFWGIFSTFSLYFETLVDYFDSSYAVIGTVGTGVAAFSSFVGTLPGILASKYPHPLIFGIGGLVMAAAYFGSSYTTADYQLYFTYSILFGVSGGILSQLSISLLFDTLPEEIVGLVVIGSNSFVGLGYIFFACISAYVLYGLEVSWTILFRYFSLAGLSITLMSFFLISRHSAPSSHPTQQDIEEVQTLEAVANVTEESPLLSSSSKDKTNSSTFAAVDEKTNSSTTAVSADSTEPYGFELLYHKADVRNLFVSNFVGMATRNLPLKFSIIYMSAISSDGFIYYTVPICIGICVAISRVYFGYLFMDKDKVNAFQMNKYSQFASGLTCVCIALSPTSWVWWQLLLLCLHEVVAGASVLIPLRMVQLIGKKHHHHNFGVRDPCLNFIGFESNHYLLIFEGSSGCVRYGCAVR